jgi:hypothetical protein
MDNIISIENHVKDQELFNKIINHLQDKQFFAVSFDANTNKYICHEFYMTNEQIVYACECMKQRVLNEDLL